MNAPITAPATWPPNASARAPAGSAPSGTRPNEIMNTLATRPWYSSSAISSITAWLSALRMASPTPSTSMHANPTQNSARPDITTIAVLATIAPLTRISPRRPGPTLATTTAAPTEPTPIAVTSRPSTSGPRWYRSTTNTGRMSRNGIATRAYTTEITNSMTMSGWRRM